MRTIRRAGGLAFAGLLLGGVVAGPAASAQEAAPETMTRVERAPARFAGGAAGQALRLAGLGQNFTAGGSEAKAASDGTGSATGTGVSVVGASVVKAANPPGETKAETCGAAVSTSALPAPLKDVLSLGLGCGEASATGDGMRSAAAARGEVADLDVNLETVLSSQAVTQTVVDTLSGALNTVCNTLPAQTKPAGCAVTQEAQAVFQSLRSTKTLSADIGTSESAVKATGASVSSEATASGAVIKVLPLATLNGVPLGEPLATITVSRANAKVLCDVGSGDATPSFDAPIVRIKLAGPIAAVLPQVADVIGQVITVTVPVVGTPTVDPTIALQNGELTVTPGASVVLFPGLPIQTEIVVGSGTKKVDGNGGTATADGVKIHALQLAPAPLAGGLLLDLAHAEAVTSCAEPVFETARSTPAAPVTPEVTRELPRTGGTPWMPIAGVAGLALVVITRRAVVRSH